MILWFSTTALLIKILGYLLPWWFVARVQNSTIDRFFIGIVFGLDCVTGIEDRNCTEYSIGKAPAQIESLGISIFFNYMYMCIYKKGEGLINYQCIVTTTNDIISIQKTLKIIEIVTNFRIKTRYVGSHHENLCSRKHLCVNLSNMNVGFISTMFFEWLPRTSVSVGAYTDLRKLWTSRHK